MDLKRTGKLVERVRQYNTRTFPAADNIQDHRACRPIPANRIQRTLNDYFQNS